MLGENSTILLKKKCFASFDLKHTHTYLHLHLHFGGGGGGGGGGWVIHP